MNKIYTPSNEEVKSAIAEATQYYHYILQKEIGEYWETNGWVLNAIKEHPFYNGNFQIVLPEKEFVVYPKDIDRINKFIDYLVGLDCDADVKKRILFICRYAIHKDTEYIDDELRAKYDQKQLGWITPHKGKKITRVIGDIAKHHKFSEKYPLWNRYFAILCDAIKSKTIRHKVIVSCNPADLYYLGEAWGKKSYNMVIMKKHMLPGFVAYSGSESDFYGKYPNIHHSKYNIGFIFGWQKPNINNVTDERQFFLTREAYQIAGELWDIAHTK